MDKRATDIKGHRKEKEEYAEVERAQAPPQAIEKCEEAYFDLLHFQSISVLGRHKQLNARLPGLHRQTADPCTQLPAQEVNIKTSQI